MRRYTLQINGKEFVVDVEELTADTFRVRTDGESLEVRLRGDEDLAQAIISPEITPRRAISHDSRVATGPSAPSESSLEGGNRGSSSPESRSAPHPAPRRPLGSGGAAVLTAPMPGVILAVETSPGASVTRGQVLLVLEAMKMKNAIKAARDGVIAEIYVQPDQPVGHGDPLLRFRED